MELDDLKKSWSMLDKQLQKDPIVDKKQIVELIAKYQENATRTLNELTRFQRRSLIFSIPVLVLAVIFLMVQMFCAKDFNVISKALVMLVYILLTAVLAIWWDLKTYRFVRKTNVSEMSTIETLERMNTFRKWTNGEFLIGPFWAIGFFALYYWQWDYYMQPLTVQLTFILLFVISLIIISIFLYRKIFRRLNGIKKAMDEIKELEELEK